MRDTLICTVGTSLMGNVARADDAELVRLLDDRNAKGLAVRLGSFEPDEHLLGAEINSIHSIVSQGLITERKKLLFLVSDTDDGRFTGNVLSLFFNSSSSLHRFEDAGYEVIEGLTDTDVNLFRNTGLKNLVRLIAGVVRRFGAGRVLINATGGYKAQISFAGMIGQALGIPVCYLFERFSSVIQLPPQPISLDLSFWLEFADTFYLLDKVDEDDACNVDDERFSSLVEEIDLDGKRFRSLSPTGQLFHETFRYRFSQKSPALLPEDSGMPPEKKKVRFEDGNTGKHKGLENYLGRICEVPYVKEIYTHYYHPDLTKPSTFRRPSKDISAQVEGWFCNAGALTKFAVNTTAATEEQVSACIADLNERFGA